MKKIIIALFSLVFVFPSCAKFLEEYTQNLAYVETATDLDEMLIGSAYYSLGVSTSDSYITLGFLNYMDDDISSNAYRLPGDEPKSMGDRLKNFYTWDEYPFQEDIGATYHGTSKDWGMIYERLAAVNTILVEVERFQDDPKYRRVKGEALFLRGFYYFYLTNIWAKPYDVKTADTDLGVPIKLTSYFEDKGFARNSVAECYNQMVTDFSAAVELLEGQEYISPMRTNVTAARIFLGRTYLYMGMYEEADKLFTVALEDKKYSLLNFNNYSTTTEITAAQKLMSLDQTSPEVIFTGCKVDLFAVQTTYWGIILSDELKRLYEDNDLRYVSDSQETPFFDKASNQLLGIAVKSSQVRNSGLGCSLPDLLLYKAETAAMLDKTQEAIDALRTLKEKRMSEVPEMNYSGEELVKYVRDERRREMCFRYHRWFDLRRYAVAPKYPEAKTIRHDMYEYDESSSTATFRGYYLLEAYPNDGAWVLPFPEDAILRNDGALIQNERPVERVLYTE